MSRESGIVRLPAVLLDEVSKCLCLMDISALRKTNAVIRRGISARLYSFREGVHRRLGKYYRNPEALLQRLHAHGNWLTGSFLVQCWLGVEWLDADVDVLCFSQATSWRSSILPERQQALAELILLKDDCKEAIEANELGQGEGRERLWPLVPQFLSEVAQRDTPTTSSGRLRMPLHPTDMWLAGLGRPGTDDTRSSGGWQESTALHAALAAFEAQPDGLSDNWILVDWRAYSYPQERLTLVERKPALDIVHVGYRSTTFCGWEPYSVRGWFPGDMYGRKLPEFSSVAEFVRREADFPFTQMLFDGHSRLMILHPEALRLRACEINMDDFHVMPFYNDAFLEPWNERRRLVRMKMRVEKYRKRGFRIMTDLPKSDATVLQLAMQDNIAALSGHTGDDEEDENCAGDFDELSSGWCFAHHSDSCSQRRTRGPCRFHHNAHLARSTDDGRQQTDASRSRCILRRKRTRARAGFGVHAQRALQQHPARVHRKQEWRWFGTC